MNQLEIFTKNNCPQCVRAKRLLNTLGINFTETSLEENPEMVEVAKDAGIRRAPFYKCNGVLSPTLDFQTLKDEVNKTE